MVMAGVRYGHMHGDYVYRPEEGIEIQCLREPADEEERQKVYESLHSAVNKVAVLLAKKKRGITPESMEDLIWSLTIGMRAWTVASALSGFIGIGWLYYLVSTE
jgi:hypothetical protein